MKIKLKSVYSCLVKGSKDSFDLDENDILEIENEDRLFVYPISTSSRNIPFYINLINPQSCERYDVVDIEDFKLILLKDNEKLISYNKESLSFPNDTCEIQVYQNAIKFENKNYAVEYECPHNYMTYKVFKLEDFACVEFDNNNLYCFNMKNNKLIHFYGDEIDLQKNVLQLNSKLNDCEDRVKNSTYKFEDASVKLESVQYSREEKNFEKDMTPYRFLEALKVKDFSFAKYFLDSNLQSKISEETLSKFLGNINNFLPLSTQEFIVLSNENKNFVRFHLKSDKIVDISVDKL